ncbi:MAG: shikimate kinase [Sphingobacteriaceae bacterium]|nr:shikimate kinase [Sphingobacteriaceae bacterium]
MKRIYLIGMPGSGKSTSGKRFAKALGWGYADLDKLVSLRSGKSIAQLFQQEGELAFRTWEQKCLHETALSSCIVVACGGGTAAWFDNMDWMCSQGKVIWLNISTDELKRRILNSKNERPLFAGLDEAGIELQIEKLFQARNPFFERASMQVQSEKALLDLVTVLREHFQKA